MSGSFIKTHKLRTVTTVKTNDLYISMLECVMNLH